MPEICTDANLQLQLYLAQIFHCSYIIIFKPQGLIYDKAAQNFTKYTSPQDWFS